MKVGCTILPATAEAGIYENWIFLDNQLTYNAFINSKYLFNTRDAPYEQYLCVYCNTVLKHKNKIGDLPIYPDPV